MSTTTMIVGGSAGLGLAVARQRVERGDHVIVTSRCEQRADRAAQQLPGPARGVGLELTEPRSFADALSEINRIDRLVLAATERGGAALPELNVDEATRVVTAKLVGYLELTRLLRPRFSAEASVVLFGGTAKDRPEPRSTLTTVTTQAVSGMVRTLASQLAPHRVNAIHPGAVGDSPRWASTPEPPGLARTPIGRLVTTAEVVHAVEFLLTNTGINAQDLHLDGGVTIT
ncbi:short-chain dehydrogenase [Actinopolyspora erythraea]|uniref:Short-chain dehydrogenase n=1 Tax=Actinopolyspora erythraea TaxID=414996 RepID=A0A099D622_9ACTN|nr:SDR family oxidoreductase [Actinopolyspora erythraea]ASU78619.1 short-chain dehydrogenase [Actinopolyspora erythraea]KGI81381.1 short-chain dehydrogenase [Actinopolyspora erythraea]